MLKGGFVLPWPYTYLLLGWLLLPRLGVEERGEADAVDGFYNGTQTNAESAKCQFLSQNGGNH